MISSLVMATVLALPADPSPPSVERRAAHSSRGHDMRGPLPSMYRGRYYHSSQEPLRRCIGQREGMFQYDVRGGGGGNYFGTYQFSSAFQNGIPYMMAKESRRTHDGLVIEALSLRRKPINQWSRYWQDRAFYTVLNFNGIGSGRHHWNGGRWAC